MSTDVERTFIQLSTAIDHWLWELSRTLGDKDQEVPIRRSKIKKASMSVKKW